MKKTISFTLEEEMIEDLKSISEEENINLSSLVRELFESWLEERGE
jgi:predicted DNA-binding protein